MVSGVIEGAEDFNCVNTCEEVDLLMKIQFKT